ncbi:MAG: glycosyltransferase family 4 protein [candidate division Zixibacteria bacterium]|nr:glycosyltransferase family 4 protein [Candidatus Tariuqbacter arcticus]
MRRTLLITNDYPPVVSGISTFLYQLWKRLDPDFHTVLTPRVTGGKEFDRGKTVRVIRHPSFSGSGGLVKLINAVVQFFYAAYLIIFRGVKRIYGGQIWVSGTIGLLAKKIFGIPYYLWVYGGETTSVYMSGSFSDYWAKILLKNAGSLLTISDYCQKEFLDYGFPAEKCPIILPGVDSTVFTPGAPPKDLIVKRNTSGKKILLTVARISERKGHDLVIRALPELLEKHPDILYLIVGRGSDEGRLQELAEQLGVSEMVKFCGFVPDEELPDYYRLCDIYVMPNREIIDSTDSIEGFGISFIEASACAKPVIGGKSGGAIEAVAAGISGYLIDPNSVDVFVEIVDKLLSDPDLCEQIGGQGRCRVEEEMDWRYQTETINKLAR